ncbi:hypothetical protein SprV_0200791100 [Sparganum proliferum]
MDIRMCQQPSADSLQSREEISPLSYQDGAFGRWNRFVYTKSANSLLLWSNEVSIRKKLQDHVAGKIRRKIPELLMSSTNPGYDRMLHNELMDRILPLVSNGKTARLKSEFWFQPEVVGRFYDEGIRVSRTKRDQGILPPLEHIGRPNPRCFDAAPSKADSLTSDEQSCSVKHLKGRHPWHILLPVGRKIRKVATYKEERLASLKPLFDELVPIKPALEELLVVGRNAEEQSNMPKVDVKTANSESQKVTDKEYVLEREKTYFSATTSSGERETEMDSVYTSLPVMFSGCALRVDDDQFFCLSEDTANNNPRSVEIEIAFELLPKSRAFGRPKDNEQRFFFNASNDIIRPGEERTIPVSFQSCREGIYSETWAFWTRPSLNGCHPIMVRFFGNAIWSERHSDDAWDLESPIELIEKRATYRMVQRITHELLKNLKIIRPSERTHILGETEEDIFKAKNPMLYYTADGVEKLQKLIGDISSKKTQDPDVELVSQTTGNLRQWDLSVSSIKQIVEAHRTGLLSTTVFNECLRKLYTIVDGLTKQPVINEESIATERYRLAFYRITDCLLKSFDHYSNVMLSMNMDEISLTQRTDIQNKWKNAFAKLKATPEFQESLRNRSYDNRHHLVYRPAGLTNPNSNEDNDLRERARAIGDQGHEQQQQQQQQHSAPGKVTMYPFWREKSEVLVREELSRTIMEIIGIWVEMG